MNSDYPLSSALATVPVRHVVHRTRHHPKVGHRVQLMSNMQDNESHKKISTTNLPITITSDLIDDARAVFDPSRIRRELVWGDETIWQTFLETQSLGRFKGRTLVDFSPFHAIAPQHLKRTKKVSLSLVWVIERLRGMSSSQPIILKPGAFVFLQDTFRALHISNPRLPSMFGMIGGMAWAEPGYQIHYFTVIAQSNVYPPVDYPIIYSIVAIPTFYLDPNRSPAILSSPSIGQRQIRDTNLWARPLRIGETEFDGTIMREEEAREKEGQVDGNTG
jgi:hypothetical protein